MVFVILLGHVGISTISDRTHAFYARKISNMLRHETDTVIIYEQIILNYGGYYKEYEGQYIAPFRGIYVFMMTAVTYQTSTVVHMIHNGQEVSRIWSINTNTGDQSASMMAILLLQLSDEVHTVLKSRRSLYGNGHSHWGGFLLATV